MSDTPAEDGRFASLASMKHEKSLLEIELTKHLEEFTRRYQILVGDVEIAYSYTGVIVKVRI